MIRESRLDGISVGASGKESIAKWLQASIRVTVSSLSHQIDPFLAAGPTESPGLYGLITQPYQRAWSESVTHASTVRESASSKMTRFAAVPRSLRHFHIFLFDVPVYEIPVDQREFLLGSFESLIDHAADQVASLRCRGR